MLQNWIGDNRQRIERLLKLDFLESKLSPFSGAFLAHCIRQSVWVGLCRKKVHSILDVERWELYDAQPGRYKNAFGKEVFVQTYCTYLDGIMLQRGLKMPAARAESLYKNFKK